MATGRAQHDVAADFDVLAPVKSRNFASVTEPARAGELLRAIEGYSGPPITAFAGPGVLGTDMSLPAGVAVRKPRATRCPSHVE